jgi:hypothetical protein
VTGRSAKRTGSRFQCPVCLGHFAGPVAYGNHFGAENAEGVYLATSDDVRGLVAQGRTIQETIEIARDVAKKLIEANAGASASGGRVFRLPGEYRCLMGRLAGFRYRDITRRLIGADCGDGLDSDDRHR